MCGICPGKYKAEILIKLLAKSPYFVALRLSLSTLIRHLKLYIVHDAMLIFIVKSKLVKESPLCFYLVEINIKSCNVSSENVFLAATIA